MDYQTHFDRQFYLDKKTGYWISSDYSKERPRIRAHRWVWECVNGKIPKGYHIHHIDNDKSNNKIENLELIKSGRHCGFHMQEKMKDAEYKKKSIDNMNIIRPLTKKWHASDEGKAWHRYHAIRCKFGLGEKIKYNCQQCNVEYESRLKAKGRTKFCSNNCKSAYRRSLKLDNESRNCVFCGMEYDCNKYSKSKSCSTKCAMNLSWSKRKSKI